MKEIFWMKREKDMEHTLIKITAMKATGLTI